MARRIAGLGTNVERFVPLGVNTDPQWVKNCEKIPVGPRTRNDSLRQFGKIELLDGDSWKAPWPDECLQLLAEPQVPNLNKLRKGRNVLQTHRKRGHLAVCHAILARPDFLLVTEPRIGPRAQGGQGPKNICRDDFYAIDLLGVMPEDRTERSAENRKETQPQESRKLHP